MYLNEQIPMVCLGCLENKYFSLDLIFCVGKFCTEPSGTHVVPGYTHMYVHVTTSSLFYILMYLEIRGPLLLYGVYCVHMYVCAHVCVHIHNMSCHAHCTGSPPRAKKVFKKINNK